MTGKIIKSLADGQISSSKATLYTAPTSTSTVVKGISLVNTSSGVIRVNLYFLASGGTSRRIIPYDMEFAGYYSFIVDDDIAMEEGDIIQGDASTGSVIDYVISGIEVT